VALAGRGGGEISEVGEQSVGLGEFTGASGGRVRVVEVTAHRPTVPDDPGGAGVLVVLTAGTRTAWELVGLAQACADAGQDVLGVVVVTPTVPARPEPVVPAGAVLAGSP
ncbi:hypothetical protein BLA60_40710, partial [Actinophytocola xinjiangensis]